MTDRETVIKGLEKVWDAFNAMEHELYADYVFDALELLKEHEQVCLSNFRIVSSLYDLLKEQNTVEHALDILREHGWKETEDVPYANEQERHPVIVCPHCGKRVK